MFQKISEHLYVYEDTCQVYAVTDGSSAVLIDFGSGRVLDDLSGLSVTCVKAVLVTHHHRDQIQGLAEAYRRGIPIYVPHAERELIEHADSMWQAREIYNNYNTRQDRFSILHSVPVTDTLKDYSTVSFGNITFRVLPTPGHTTGSVTLETEIDGVLAAFTGDLIYAPGKVWSLSATQWSYNGGEGLPHTILSLLFLQERGIQTLFPSHGLPMALQEAVPPTVERLAALIKVRKQNPRLFLLRETPYQKISEHLLFNRTSMCDSYVLLSDSGKALILDLGYDFMAGTAAGTDRSSRRPWLYTIPALFEKYGVREIHACISTHYHDDHVAGFNLLRDVYGAQVWCADSFADILENPSHYDLPCLWYDPILVDRRLPLESPVKWEEYELTLHPFSGHTRYAVAIEFTADGKKVLCTGDQYADEDGLFCNYVYKNTFDYDDFIYSAALIRKLAPDLILTGHWQYKDRGKDYLEKLAEVGNTVCRLHRELLPPEKASGSSGDFPVSLSPYQVQAPQNTAVSVTVSARNPYPYSAQIQLQIVLPDSSWTADTDTLVLQADAHALCIGHMTIRTPDTPVRRARIGCNVTIGTTDWGQLAEMLITVNI